MNQHHLFTRAALALALATGTVPIAGSPAAAQQAPQRPVISTQAELPRFTYEIPTSTASALLSDAAFYDVAARVRTDVEALLAGYQIDDRATLRGLHSTLESLALLRGDFDAALRHAADVRALQEKPAERLLSGILTEALVAAGRAGEDEAARQAAFRASFAASIQSLPWDVVRDAVKQAKGDVEIVSRNLYLGLVQSQYDPAATQARSISGDVARTIIGMREVIDLHLPFRETRIDVLQAYIDAHDVAKPDIWAARDVVLSSDRALHPVVIGIWDTGVDMAVFGSNAYRNTAETQNGRDDDGNGFIDDVHGVAWTLWGQEPTPAVLHPLTDEDRARIPHMLQQLKGLFDIQASIDSPEATALKRRLSEMQPEEVQPFMEQLQLFAIYVHGTHVAGIAAAGNPAARVLVVRETFPHEMISPPLYRAEAERWAANMQRTIDYMKAAGVRVVNMSWGMTAAEIEHSYEMNNVGADAEERQRMAQEAFDVLMTGMRNAMRSAPEILFIPAAGNTDEDVRFVADMPASIDLPNVLSVGAVDQAGEETSFTSHGSTVRAHANGFQVDSYLPGGTRLPLSGTSMAAPNVANLAAKLLAVDPTLSTEQVVRLILDGAETTEDGRRTLIHPRRSLELLEARTTGRR